MSRSMINNIAIGTGYPILYNLAVYINAGMTLFCNHFV